MDVLSERDCRLFADSFFYCQEGDSDGSTKRNVIFHDLTLVLQAKGMDRFGQLWQDVRVRKR